MDWQEEPATNQQLLRLREVGFVPNCSLTVTQAARLIRQYSKHPGRTTAAAPAATSSAAHHAPAHTAEQASRPFQPRLERVSEAARMQAYQLRAAAEAARRLAAANPDLPGIRADVQSAVSARQQFWLDTCHENAGNHVPSAHALEFYQHLGAAFFTPTWAQVGEVLDALDHALHGWDKDHPELFYETLKLNYPSLVRHK